MSNSPEELQAEVVSLRAQVAALRGLVSSVYLYVNDYYVTKQLTTEQKELWADTIDEHSRRACPEEFHPYERWWR